METSALPESNTLRAILAEQLEAKLGDLADRYQQVLQELLFHSRSDIRPKVLAAVATDEAETFKAYLLMRIPSGLERGQQLSQLGLGEDAVLHLGRTTRQFFFVALNSDFLSSALDIYDSYHNTVLQGFVQARTMMMLSEQERIRGALHRAIDRYTVEIQEVQEMAQKAVEANEFKTSFIAQISHDLRTPLGAIMGLSEMLLEDVYGPMTDAQRDPLTRVLSNAQMLSRAFTELLDQSRLEAGQLQIREKPFSPHKLAKAVQMDCLPLALRKGLAITLRLEPDLPLNLLGDEIRIGQVLSNLIVNAIKYTDKGRIMVRVGLEDDIHWMLSVKDTGIGIPPEAQQYIFEPYRQVDETKTRTIGGVGLGLAIVRQMAVAMGGTASVESRVGQGSTFKVVLPLRSVDA
jgi:signal transduction histidine kinase